MVLTYIEGDLLQYFNDRKIDVIGHGCNCFCTMGAGIAKSISDEYPGAYELDRRTKKGDKTKLGTIGSYEKKPNGIHDTKDGSIKFPLPPQYIVNCYTQYGCGMKNGQAPIDYAAVRSCMKAIKNRFPGRKFGFPMIGAGLAGGDWNVISKIIEEELNGEDVTIVVYKPNHDTQTKSVYKPNPPTGVKMTKELKEKIIDDFAEKYKRGELKY